MDLLEDQQGRAVQRALQAQVELPGRLAQAVLPGLQAQVELPGLQVLLDHKESLDHLEQ